MVTPKEKLAESLEILRDLQEQGIGAISTKQLPRLHRERLIKNGFLTEVIKGWYISTRPDEPQGESTSWYASFWAFCASYLNKRFKNVWCLSPEQSLLIHAENWTVPKQLLVRSPKGRNKVTHFLYNTSLLDARYHLPEAREIVEKDNLRIFSLTASLLYVSPRFFVQHPIDAKAALAMVRDSSEILHALLEGGHSTIAGRLCGAFRNIGYERIADDINKTMLTAGYNIRENDPFTTETPFFSRQYKRVPAVNRMNIMWYEMRETIIKTFPPPAEKRISTVEYLKNVDIHYASDAYHSLSIEGYQVNRELIEKVRKGNWNPDYVEQDRNQRNALAARGYWQAFNAVKKSIRKVLNGKNPGEVADMDHGDWYRELFQPSVVAGILSPSDLAGYRNNSVYIRGSMYAPPRYEMVRELMPVFFENLCEEKEASVRVVLGHFFFVYIHPYMDGNGRIGRFLMNVMLASGGYPWTIIPVEKRDKYMSSLEEASTNQNIKPFSNFIADCVSDALKKK